MSNEREQNDILRLLSAKVQTFSNSGPLRS